MTAFVPGFQHDLFISYAHEDDKRWIQAFEDELRDEISRRLGMGISVWQDTSRIRAGENWQVAIQEGIEGAAAFVAVVSPRYQNSQWCARERNEFRKRFKAEQFTTSGRFFKAIKTPWSENAHRFFLQEIQDVDFYKDDRTGPWSSRPARATSSGPFASWPTVWSRSSDVCAEPTSGCTWRGRWMNASPRGSN